MFWAEAVATEVRSVVTVMPVTRMPLTPRLKRVWRRINKAKGPPIARQRSPGAPSLNGFGDRRKYDLRMPGVRRLEPIADDVPTSPPITCDTAATAACFFQRVELAVATESRLRTILAAIVRSSAAGNRGTRAGGQAGAPGWERGSLGSYRGALDLRWDRSASYCICPEVGGAARSRRGQCWTAGRVCTLFSFRNDPPEESRSPCVARARGELGNGVCFRTCSRRVGATGSRRGQCWTASRV